MLHPCVQCVTRSISVYNYKKETQHFFIKLQKRTEQSRSFEVKTPAKFCLRSSLLFSIIFSISISDMPDNMITSKDQLKLNLVCYMHMHLPCQENYLQDQIGEFLSLLESFISESFVFYLTNTNLICSWSVFDSTFSELSPNVTCG